MIVHQSGVDDCYQRLPQPEHLQDSPRPSVTDHQVSSLNILKYGRLVAVVGQVGRVGPAALTLLSYLKQAL